jgi:hypothetical protein
VLTATGYVPIEAGAGGANAPANVARMSDLSAETSKGAKAEAKSGNWRGARVTLAKDYDPEQPRVPAGNPDGGQWTTGDSGGSSRESSDGSDANSDTRPVQYAALDAGTRTDAADGGTTDSSPDANPSNSNGQLAQNKVTPRGFTIQQGPGENPLDPKQLNTPISADEQQKIADALTLKENGDTGALQPHPYANLPHHATGAVLPASTSGYTAYDVPGLGTGRGEGRLIVDKATGATYYTNNHYQSFYAIQIHQHGE